MSSEHPVTYYEAETINVYEHLDYLVDAVARPRSDPATHLEDLARTAVVVHRFDRWQAIGVHRAVLAGATLHELSLALGEPSAAVVERWRGWSAGQRDLWERWRTERPDSAKALSFRPDEHDHVAAQLAQQLATANSSGEGR